MYADDRARHLKEIERVQQLQSTFQHDGWILDCVTWEKHWESATLETKPHDFSLAGSEKILEGEDSSHRRQTFQEIFEKKDWPAKDPSYPGLQSSGPGALLKNSQRAIAVLHSLITRLKSHLGKHKISLLDVPCGDLQWMSKFLATRSDIIYTGADIIPDIIQHHQKAFSRIPKARFIQLDIVDAPLNQSYDLVLVRDLLQHLWQADAMKVLQRLSDTRSRFLLATTFPDTTTNQEVEKDALGSRRSQYNLELPPFLLPPPVCMTYDWNVEHLALWQLPLQQKYDYY